MSGDDLVLTHEVLDDLNKNHNDDKYLNQSYIDDIINKMEVAKNDLNDKEQDEKNASNQLNETREELDVLKKELLLKQENLLKNTNDLNSTFQNTNNKITSLIEQLGTQFEEFFHDGVDGKALSDIQNFFFEKKDTENIVNNMGGYNSDIYFKIKAQNVEKDNATSLIDYINDPHNINLFNYLKLKFTLGDIPEINNTNLDSLITNNHLSYDTNELKIKIDQAKLFNGDKIVASEILIELLKDLLSIYITPDKYEPFSDDYAKFFHDIFTQNLNNLVYYKKEKKILGDIQLEIDALSVDISGNGDTIIGLINTVNGLKEYYNTTYNAYVSAQTYFNSLNELYIVLMNKYNLLMNSDYNDANQYDPYYNMEDNYSGVYKDNTQENLYSQNFDGSSKVERIFIDSRNRISTSASSTNFTYEFKDKQPLKYVNKLTLLSHNIDFNSQYLINDNNNVFRIYSSSFKQGDIGVHTELFNVNHNNANFDSHNLCYKEVKIPIANYSLQSLANYLQGYVRTMTNRFEAVKYNKELNRFEFNNIPCLDNEKGQFLSHISDDEYNEKDVFMGKMKLYIMDSNNSDKSDKKHVIEITSNNVDNRKFVTDYDDNQAITRKSYMVSSDNLKHELLWHIYKLISDQYIVNYTYKSKLYFTDGSDDYVINEADLEKLNTSNILNNDKFSKSRNVLIQDGNSKKHFYVLLFNYIKYLINEQNFEPDSEALNKALQFITPKKDDDTVPNQITSYEINLTRLYILLKINEYNFTTYINKAILDQNTNNKFYYFFKFSNNVDENHVNTLDSKTILNILGNSLGNVIGFNSDKLYTGMKNTFSFKSNKSLSLEKNPYIYLSINNYNNYDIFDYDKSIKVNDMSDRNKAVSFIINDASSDKDTNLSSIKFEEGIHIDKFNIRLLDFYGSIVNFGNKDFFVELEIERGIINNY